MTAKKAGVADMMIRVHLHSQDAVDWFLTRFYVNARKQGGAVTALKMDQVRLGPHDYEVIVSYKHTCINQGARVSDAKEAVSRALRRKWYRHSVDVLRDDWTPLPSAEAVRRRVHRIGVSV